MLKRSSKDEKFEFLVEMGHISGPDYGVSYLQVKVGGRSNRFINAKFSLRSPIPNFVLPHLCLVPQTNLLRPPVGTHPKLRLICIQK
jgi:hypothetical protein